MEPTVLYHDKDRVKVGGVVRYDVSLGYVPPDQQLNSLFVRVRNLELVALRAAYLNGPYTVYCDMVPLNYDEDRKVAPEDMPKYENHVKASSHFSAELRIPANLASGGRKWRITIMSEILFSRSAEVRYEISFGTSKSASKVRGKSAKAMVAKTGQALADQLKFSVIKTETSSIWQQPLPKPNEPLHVCVLTHGLVSNVTADMLYVKELVDAAAKETGENIVCKGYTGNVCRTERGVKYLGRRLARWLIDELIPTYKPAKLSFIAHSLGGLIQTYALGYIEANAPEILRNIELVNFVALATPFLGISNENPGYVQFALNFGVVGLTGLDLGLSHLPGVTKPLLEEIPNVKTRSILNRFKYRTVYANAVNDGIVPLRTASLLYLDWWAIGTANAAHKNFKRKHFHKHMQKVGGGGVEMNEGEIEMMEMARERKKVANKSGNSHQAENKSGRNDKHKHRDDDEEEEFVQVSSESSPSSENKEALDTPEPPQATYRSPIHRSESTLEDPHRNLHKLSVSDSPNHSSSSSSPETSPVGSPSRENTLASFLFGNNKQNKIIKRSQTVNASDELDLEVVGEQLPRRTSLIESGMSLLMPPHPNHEFITDPSTRDDVIFHDRIYYQQDLPERRFKSKIHIIRGQKERVEVAKGEERIARSYHEGTSWRKVLVEMLPEAHNNIIVRRRFSNAYGWPVVHHLVREHFIHPAEINERALKLSQELALRDGDIDNHQPTAQTSASEPGESAPENTGNPWLDSEGQESEPDRDIDPHHASMLKIVSRNDA